MSFALLFRRLRDEEEESAYRLICETVDWLKAKGIPLWDKPLPREIYARRQRRGENYGLFADGRLAAILSLVHGAPDYWTAEVGRPDALWLSTLAKSRAFRDARLGRLAVRRALDFLWDEGWPDLYLDCKPGFLERFYRALGFAGLSRQQKWIPHAGAAFDVVLMRRSLRHAVARIHLPDGTGGAPARSTILHETQSRGMSPK